MIASASTHRPSIVSTDTVASDYNHQLVEQRAQQRWDKSNCFRTREDDLRPKYFCQFLFPSLAGPVHVGHCRNFVLCDAMARYQRLQGKNVMQSLGWEAFGLPVHLAALATDTDPKDWVQQMADEKREVIRRLGLALDWQREIDTCAAGQYRWQQQLFVRLWQQNMINPDKKTGVAYWDPGTNAYVSLRQIVNGRGPESGMLIEIHEVDSYEIPIPLTVNEQLLQGLDGLNHWDSFVKSVQRESVGLEDGLLVTFQLHDLDGTNYEPLDVFTSHPDTIMGTTFLAVAIEHPLARAVAAHNPEVHQFCSTVSKPDYAYQKMGEEKRQEGLPLGVYAINPVNGDHIPVWVTNYVVAGYGTGAVLGIPAHDKRSFNFARRHNLPMRRVAFAPGKHPNAALRAPFVGPHGIVINSGALNDAINACKASMDTDSYANATDDTSATTLDRKRAWDARINSCVLDFLRTNNVAATTTTVTRLRGWKISQQDYWGCPVPLIHCESCGKIPVPDNDLPVELPVYERGKDTLAAYPDFIACPCPICGNAARRDTDTLVNLFDSSWHFAHLACPDTTKLFDDSRLAHWLPVDFYCCGVEHATNHLLCARIMHRFMLQLGILPDQVGNEPFRNLLCQGPVLNYGLPMSPKYGNAISAGPLLDECGADLLRLYLVTSADPHHALYWDDSKLFALQGLLSAAELDALRNATLAGTKKDIAYRLLSENEITRLQHGLINQREFRQLCEGTLAGVQLDRVHELLDADQLQRLRHGILSSAGLSQLRKGELDPDKLTQVQEKLDELEIRRLQLGLLDKHEFSKLQAGTLPAKKLAQVRDLLSAATVSAIQQTPVDIEAPGAVFDLQERLLDHDERTALEHEKAKLELLRQARSLLTDGEISRLEHGLLDRDEFRQLELGKLPDIRLAQVEKLIGPKGIARLQAGALDDTTWDKLHRCLPHDKDLEKLRQGQLSGAKLRQVQKLLSDDDLHRFQAATLPTKDWNRLVNFLPSATQKSLDAVLDTDAQTHLRTGVLSRQARPLLRFLDRTRLDLVLNYIDDTKMDRLVNFLVPERMEQILGFPGYLWHLVVSKKSLITASSPKVRPANHRRAQLHKCLQAINTSYAKPATSSDHNPKTDNRDLELRQVFTQVRKIMALLDTAASPTQDDDCEFATEACPLLLQVLHPIMPHLTEELWAELGLSGLLAESHWPEVDTQVFASRAAVMYVIQENGRKRLIFNAAGDLDRDAAKERALTELKHQAWERGYPNYPKLSEEIVEIKYQNTIERVIINFVTHSTR